MNNHLCPAAGAEGQRQSLESPIGGQRFRAIAAGIEPDRGDGSRIAGRRKRVTVRIVRSTEALQEEAYEWAFGGRTSCDAGNCSTASGEAARGLIPRCELAGLGHMSCPDPASLRDASEQCRQCHRHSLVAPSGPVAGPEHAVRRAQKEVAPADDPAPVVHSECVSGTSGQSHWIGTAV